MSIKKIQTQTLDDQKICFRCYQTIYQLELFGPILGQFYHKTCFRCIYCDRYLDLKTFVSNPHDLSDKHAYCSSHVPRTKNQYVFFEVKKTPNDSAKNVDTAASLDTKTNSESKMKLLPELENILAKLKLCLRYVESTNKLTILILEAIILVSSRENCYYITIKLLPEENENGDRHTKKSYHNSNPIWNERFEYYIENSIVSSKTLCISLNSENDSLNNTCLSKLNLKLDSVDLLKGSTKWYHMAVTPESPEVSKQ